MAKRISNVSEWAEVLDVDHLVHLRLGDESDTENPQYTLALTTENARALASELVAAADSADDYAFGNEEPTQEKPAPAKIRVCKVCLNTWSEHELVTADGECPLTRIKLPLDAIAEVDA